MSASTEFEPILIADHEAIEEAKVEFAAGAHNLEEAALPEGVDHESAFEAVNPQIRWIGDGQGRLLFVSERWRSLTGQPPEKSLGTGWHTIVHAEDLPAAAATIRQQLAERSPYDIRFRALLASGSYRWFRSRGFPKLDEHGEVRRVYGFTEDVHDQAVAEERLRESEEHHRYTVQLNPQIPWIADPAGNIIEGGPRWRELIAASVGEALGRGWVDLLHPDDVGPTLQQWTEALRSGEPLDTRCRFVTHGGGWRWFRSRAGARRGPAGDIVCWYGTLEDIDEQVLAQSELQRSRDLLQTVIDSVADHIFVKDRDGRFVLTNRAIDESFGSLSGHRSSRFLDDHATQAAEAIDQEVISTGRPREVEEVIPVHGDLRMFQTIKVPWLRDGETVGIVGVARDITERKKIEERALWNATRDALTNLPNRTLFHQRLTEAIVAASATGDGVGLLLLDVDHFKQVNDTLGHDAGDMMLKTFAERLQAVVRFGDTVARHGGDEFAIVLSGLPSGSDIHDIAESILSRLRDPFVYAGHILDCRASIGASVYPDHGATPEDLLKSADLALYAGKSRSRGRLTLFAPEMRSAHLERTVMVSLARDAVREDRVAPFYQPKVNLRSGKLAGFEALLRWRRPDGSFEGPGSIAAAFDDLEVAATISDRIIASTIADIRVWLDHGVNFEHVAINAAAAEFRRDDFAERVLEALRRSGVAAKHLQLEVTETVFLGRGAEHVERALRLLSAEGVRIALDDFGTGYASLRHLRQFPVDTIKIDRSFVSDMEDDPNDEAIVRTVVSLGQSLGISVVAEGIELKCQADHLLALGCDEGQGFLYSPALPAAAVPQLVARFSGRMDRALVDA